MSPKNRKSEIVIFALLKSFVPSEWGLFATVATEKTAPTFFWDCKRKYRFDDVYRAMFCEGVRIRRKSWSNNPFRYLWFVARESDGEKILCNYYFEATLTADDLNATDWEIMGEMGENE